MAGKVVRGGPAHAAGMLKGDRVVAVNQVATTGVKHASGSIMGAPGTTVRLSIYRPSQRAIYTVDLVRKAIPRPSRNASNSASSSTTGSETLSSVSSTHSALSDYTSVPNSPLRADQQRAQAQAQAQAQAHQPNSIQAATNAYAQQAQHQNGHLVVPMQPRPALSSEYLPKQQPDTRSQYIQNTASAAVPVSEAKKKKQGFLARLRRPSLGKA